jgi:hypothetical protein
MKIKMQIMKWQPYIGTAQYFPFEDPLSFEELAYTIEVEVSKRKMERHILNDTLYAYKKELFSNYLAEQRGLRAQGKLEVFRKYIRDILDK